MSVYGVAGIVGVIDGVGIESGFIGLIYRVRFRVRFFYGNSS